VFKFLCWFSLCFFLSSVTGFLEVTALKLNVCLNFPFCFCLLKDFQTTGVSSASVSGNLLVINILVCNIFGVFLLLNVTVNSDDGKEKKQPVAFLFLLSGARKT